MAAQIKKSKPTSPGRRFRSWVSREDLHKGAPHAALLQPKKQNSGRNNQGRITSRRMGGGVKRKYRLIDFKRNKYNVNAEVIRNEYDPNRSAFISLIKYEDGEYRYILSPKNIKVGDKISSGENVEIKDGNCLPLKNIPVGSNVHNIEMKPGAGGQLVRSAGTSAQIISKEETYVQIRLVSGEIRYINKNSLATIGTLSNPDQKNVKLGIALGLDWVALSFIQSPEDIDELRKLSKNKLSIFNEISDIVKISVPPSNISLP